MQKISTFLLKLSNKINVNKIFLNCQKKRGGVSSIEYKIVLKAIIRQA